MCISLPEQARGAAECERIRAKLALAGVAHGARLVEATQKALIPPREKSRAELLQSLVPTTTTYGDRLSRRPSAPQANKNGKKGKAKAKAKAPTRPLREVVLPNWESNIPGVNHVSASFDHNNRDKKAGKSRRNGKKGKAKAKQKR